MRLRLFRGITVAVSDKDMIRAHIQQNGLAGDEGGCRTTIHHPGDLRALLAKPDLTRQDTCPPDVDGTPAVYASGDEAGAAHYALIQNRTQSRTAPLMIEFEADAADLAVDGNDLLYTVFARGDPQRARPVLEYLFGSAVIPYVDAAWVAEDVWQRLALCDLAVHDPAVVLAHYANQKVIAGRSGTVFRNAFLVRLPVPAQAVMRVWTPVPSGVGPVPTVRFDELLLPT